GVRPGRAPGRGTTIPSAAAICARPAGSATHAVEAHAMPATPALAGRVPKELCRPAAPFAPPFLRGFHQPRRLQRSTETRLVQSPLEQQLVRLLEFAQRESGRQQPERNRLV